MPLTPFHLGPVALISLVFQRQVNLPVILIASIILDLEPLSVLLFGLNYSLHGFFHTLLGGSIVAGAIALAACRLRELIKEIEKSIKIPHHSDNKSLILASFLGVYSHIALDSFLYTDIKPFFPSSFNPLYRGLSASAEVYTACMVSFLLALPLYIYRARNQRPIP